MQHHREFEQDRRALQRIAVMLVTLASLCARLSLLPAPVRFAIYWFMGHAEAAAEKFVAGVLLDFGFVEDMPEECLLTAPIRPPA